jgi:hypothetical protein
MKVFQPFSTKWWHMGAPKGTLRASGLTRDWLSYFVHAPATNEAAHEGWRLADFAAQDVAREAGLNEAHILAIRLYT